MANTYTQMYIQVVFSVQNKFNLINEAIRDELEKYMCGIITNNKSKPLSIYCNPDHVHILIGLHPTISVSDLVKYIKTNSSKFINQKRWMPGKFNWQDGFGSFTYSKSQIDVVAKYILNQSIHHKKITFKEEYLSILDNLDIEYDEQYIFEWYEL
ncbi:MAG: IS200/IS605 family transposase [Bacteroidia bacterium]|nr:IS200/IS605 family transposase [Bacteroidia bacterium]